MKMLSKLTVCLLILLISTIAIGSVSAESVDGDFIASSSDVNSIAIDDVLCDEELTLNENASYIDDENYDDYFETDGTLKESVGGKELIFGNFTGKNFIINQESTVISGTNGNVLNNCTVYVGSGSLSGVSNVTIQGLKFVNNNLRNAIVLNNAISDSKILNNDITMTFDDTFSGYDYSGEGIISWYGGFNNTISNNLISISGDNGAYGDGTLDYLYGIDIVSCDSSWMDYANPISYLISNNTIIINSENAACEGIYLDAPLGSEDIPFIISDNKITVNSTSSAVADVYGIASSQWSCDKTKYVSLKDNQINAFGNNMVYGIEFYNGDDLEILNNYVYIRSNGGAFAIATSGVNGIIIKGNNLNTKGKNPSVTSYDSVGIGIAAINIPNTKNVSIEDNVIYCNRSSIMNNKNNAEILGNTYLLDDENYNVFFDKNGVLIDSSISAGETLYVLSLNNKDLTINKSITLTGNGSGYITSGTVYINANDITVKELFIANLNKNGIYLYDGVSDINILNNSIVITSLGDNTYNTYMGISTNGYAQNILIDSNRVNMFGNAGYNYAIDINDLSASWSATKSPDEITISNNDVIVQVDNVAEGIFISSSSNVIIENNNIFVKSYKNADVYGISNGDMSLWYPTLTTPTNVKVMNNNFILFGSNMVYGIELAGNELVASDNALNIYSNGGSVGIAIYSANSVDINDNEISAIGLSLEGIYTYDVVGVVNTGVFVKDSDSVNINSNNIISSFTDGNDYGVIIKNSNNTKVLENSILSNNSKNKGNLAVSCDDNVEVLDNTPKTSIVISASSFTKYYGDSKKLIVLFEDENGNAFANKKVTITISGKTYSSATNDDGLASFTINNAKGTYNVAIKYAGDNSYLAASKNVVVKVVVPTMKAVSTKVKKGKYFQVVFKDANGKVIKSQKVTFKISGKTYTVTTNSKGIGQIKLNIKKGYYNIVTGFKYTTIYGKTTSTFKVRVY